MKRSRLGSKLLPACAAMLLGATLGCGGGGGGDDGDPDAAVVRPPDASQYWSHETVDEGGVGMFAHMVITNDGPAMAYFPTKGVQGELCTELESDDPPTKVWWSLYYAQRTGEAAWDVETVADILMVGLPNGLDLQADPDGEPVISTTTGDPVAQIRYCGANDVGYYQRTSPGNWSVTAAVMNSNEAATGEPASDYGFVVGFWPGLAFDASGNPAIAYRDNHAGGMQVDDNIRSDLELAWDTGGWQHIAIDIGEGAGMYSAMQFDSSGRPVIVYTNQEAVNNGGDMGILVTRSSDGGTTWDKVKLYPGASFDGPSMAFDADDRLLIAYYQPSQGIPYIATLTDDANFDSASLGWTQDSLGDPRFDEGYDPSIAVAPDGRIAMAYYRCTRATQGIGNCNPADDGLVFAYQDAGDWTYELVDPGDSYGQCGRYATLRFDAEGNAVIGYDCQTMVGDKLEDQVRFAYREPF